MTASHVVHPFRRFPVRDVTDDAQFLSDIRADEVNPLHFSPFLGSRYDMPMKTKPKPEDVRGDSRTFVDFMRKLIAVPHEEIKAEMKAEEERRPRLYVRSSRVPDAPSED